MKKLISAASALAMAASMVGAAIPFATGAADSSKGFELRPFVNKAGESVSTTISEADIAAGDVTVPIALYLTEKTADVSFFSAQWAVDSKDGDASNSYVSFTGYNPGEAYYDENQTVSYGGEDFETNKIIGFCGTVSKNSRGIVSFSDTSKSSMYSIAEKQTSWGIENAWGSAVWSRPATDDTYTYTGAASDSFPVFVFEATFKKGTPAGTYSINFLDKENSQGVPATYIEAGNPTVRMNIKDGNLTVKGVDIVIGGASTPAATTAAPAAVTTAAPAATTAAPTVTTAAGNNNTQTEDPGFPISDDFIVEMKQDYVAKPGDTVTVEFMVSSGGHYASTFAAEVMDNLPAGITYEMTDFCCWAADPEGSKEYQLLGEKSYQANVLDSKTQDPILLTDGEAIIQFDFKIPDDIAPGSYEIGLQKFRVIEFAQVTDEHGISKFDAKLINKNIIIEGDTPATTAAPAATTTAKPAATTTAKPAATTAAPAATTVAPVVTTEAATGTPLYGDTNCDGKVNIADVVVLNKWLNNNADYNITAQGKLNADCCDEKAGAGLDKNDSDAIIRSIVHLVTLPCASADLK